MLADCGVECNCENATSSFISGKPSPSADKSSLIFNYINASQSLGLTALMEQPIDTNYTKDYAAKYIPQITQVPGISFAEMREE